MMSEHRRWLVAGVLMLAAGAAAVDIVLHQVRRNGLEHVLHEANKLDRRLLSGRVEGLDYKPLQASTRSAVRAESLPQLRLRAASAELIEATGSSKDTQKRHAAALAHLFAGHTDEAIKILGDVTTRRDAPARAWNDLAAALLQRAGADDARQTASALAAANQAIKKQPGMPEALFNRSLALERLGLEFAAREGADRYLAVDAGSQWAAEIRELLRRVDTISRADEWRQAQKELEKALLEADQGRVSALVRRFPQEARSWGEGEFLSRWCDAVIANRRDDAQQWLNAVRRVASALTDINGERQLHDIAQELGAYKATRAAEIFKKYRDGRIAFSDRKIAEAIPLLREAEGEFAAINRPLQLLAGYYLAVALLDAHDAAASEAALARVVANSRPEYQALRAQCDWHRANLLSREGRLYEAHAAVQRAFEQFEALGEEAHRTRMQNSMATALARLGRLDEAWKLRCAALRSASRSGDARTIETTLNGAVRQAIRDHEWAIAQALLEAHIERGISSPRLRADALLWLAFVESRLENRTLDIHPALLAAETIADKTLRADAVTDLHFAEAIAARTDRPKRAIELLNDVIAASEHNGSLDLPVAYVERARARRALRDLDGAAADLDRAINIVESQRADIRPDEIRDTFFGSADAVYEESVELRLAERNAGGAFAAAERMRARVVLDRAAGHTAAADEIPDAVAVQRSLPARVDVVHYTVLPERTLVVSFTNHEWHVATIAVSRDEIAQLRERLVGAISNRSEAEARAIGQHLYDILMGGLPARSGDILIVIPDETLADLPFSGLVNPGGKFLIEETAIAIAPSAAVFLKMVERGRDDQRGTTNVVVADPAFDRDLFPHLDRLSNAPKELRALSEAPAKTVALTGKNATPRRFLEHAQHAAVVHIAAHAVASRTDPSSSFFVLAPEGSDSGLLYQRDIVRSHFDATDLVVLAGCRTAAASAAPGSIRSLAMAFVTAGSRNVLGSLWDIEDSAAAELSIRFHHHLQSGSHPALALRLAQLEMLRQSDSRFRNIRDWGALQIYGTGL